MKPVLALCALALTAAATAPSAEPVVEAERAFAGHVRDKGFRAGFLAYAAPDAIVFQPGPVNPRPGLEALPDTGPEKPPLDWWPQWAGIARSGDFGFTTGPASIPVRYFTVWKKQPDGGWKWIYDGGPMLQAPMPGGPEIPVSVLAPATAAAGSAAEALAEIAPLEADLAARAATDAKTAHLAHLSEDGLIGGSPTASYPGREQQRAELDRRPATMTLKALGGDASSAGDMAFTYGQARWTKDEKARWGHYARIWQKRTEGWRLVVDLLVASPGPPPA